MGAGGLGDNACADDAGGGAGQQHADAIAPAALRRHGAASRGRQQQRRGDGGGFQLPLDLLQIGVDARMHVGIENRGGGPLIFADGRPDLAAPEHEERRSYLGDHAGNRILMPGIAPGMQEGHDNAVAFRRQRCFYGRGNRSALRRGQRLAVRVHAFIDGKHPLARHERIGAFAEQVVGVRHAQPGEFEQIGEADGGEESQARAAPLDDGVDADRCAMNKAGDRLRLQSALHQPSEPGGDILARFGRRRQDLERAEFSGFHIECGEIGKCAADINAN